MRLQKAWLNSLAVGHRLMVNNGTAGTVPGRVSRITEKLIYVRIGSELRRFTRNDGCTFKPIGMTKSWLMPMEDTQ